MAGVAAGHPPVSRQRGRLVSVGSAWHRVGAPNGTFRGLVKVDAADLPALARACAALSGLRDRSLETLAGSSGATGLALLALVRGGTTVRAYHPRGLVCGRVGDEADVAATAERLRAVDEPAVRLRLAVKEQDDLFATFAVSSFSPRLVRLAARAGLSPTAVTWLSVLLVALAAVAFAAGSRPFLIAGAALLYLGFLLDCVDGQLARYTHRYSRYGGWLDIVADRGKEYGAYAGLAVGALRTDLGDLWPLAVAAVVLQTVRHMTDAWYSALHDAAVQTRQPLPLDLRDDARSAGGGRPRLAARAGRALGRVSDRIRARRGTPAYWFKRTAVFPIGERWLVVMVTAALFDARVTFWCLLGWGAVAAAGTLTGRVLRSRAIAVPALPRRGLALHRDDGPLAALVGRLAAPPLPTTLAVVAVLGGLVLSGAPVAFAALALVATVAAGHRHDRPVDWLVPALLRAAEYLAIVVVGRQAHVPWPVVFALAVAVALWHYDLAARLDLDASPLAARRLALGWDGRVLVVVAAGLSGMASAGFAALTGYLVVLFVAQAVVGTVRAARPVGPAHRGLLNPPTVPRPRSAEGNPLTMAATPGRAP
jgi:hypothetical protein